MAGDSGVDVIFCLLLLGGEVVEPGVGAVTDRFCAVVGEQWALPVPTSALNIVSHSHSAGASMPDRPWDLDACS